MPKFEDNPNDLREQLQAAVRLHENDDEDTPKSPTEKDSFVVDTDAVAPVQEEGPVGSTDTDPAPPADQPAIPDLPAATTTATPTATPSPDEPNARAPGTWTPVAREKWGKLEPEVRQEVWKREREASRAMTISADARKFASDFEKTVQPYMGFIAAENSTPIQAVDNMMRTAALLRVGTGEQKVTLVADIIKRFGIDLEALDSMLAGQQVQNNPQRMIQQEIERATQPLMQRLQTYESIQQNNDRQVGADINREIDSFASDPKNEFFNDVQHLIPDILEIADRQGQVMSLTQAYHRAILMHDPVRSVVEARQRNQSVMAKAGAAAKARNTGASVTTSQQVSNSSPQSKSGGSIRADIEAAIAQQQGR